MARPLTNQDDVGDVDDVTSKLFWPHQQSSMFIHHELEVEVLASINTSPQTCSSEPLFRINRLSVIRFLPLPTRSQFMEQSLKSSTGHFKVLGRI